MNFPPIDTANDIERRAARYARLEARRRNLMRECKHLQPTPVPFRLRLLIALVMLAGVCALQVIAEGVADAIAFLFR